MQDWPSTALIAVMGIIFSIRGLQSVRHHCNYTVPMQLVSLVKQAHLGQPFQTLWNIEVGDAMRLALRAPLNTGRG